MRYLLLLFLAVPLAAQARERQLHDLIALSVPYSAPPQYDQWWTETRALCNCTPKVQLADLQWRLMADSKPHDRGSYWTGVDVVFMEPPDDRNPDVVKHEMLHAMLGGDPDHTNAVWRHFSVGSY